jgi:trehalose-6-phosphate synthase
MARTSSNPLQIIVLSNREPYTHERERDGQLRAIRCSSGVVNAVEPLLLEHGGVWVATGSGDADREAANNADGVALPANRPRYRLRRVWLEDAEWRGYYEGFSNSGLWPLCHRTSITPAFYAADFGMYELVNRRFAEAVSEEAYVASPVVLVQDYQCALAPALIRRELPMGRIATFWHIPWPSPDVFRKCPWSHALLEGLLGSTLIGFQTPLDRENFLRCAEPLTHVDVDENCVRWKGRRVTLGVYPASVDWPGDRASSVASVAACRAAVRRHLELPVDVVLGVGVDRLDYTKGLEEKFLAVERLLECRPDLIGRFAFVQVAEPSREGLLAYRQTRARVTAAAERINARYAGRIPIVLVPEHHDQAAVARLLRAADFCYVGSLHDGMNLVSKEFVAARDDEQGVLVLSAFAGASFELREALIVNPYDIEQVARSLSAAIDMSPMQQRHRMQRMRRVVAAWDARTWAKEILSDVCNDATARRVASPVRRYSLRNSARALDSLPSASSARNM